MTTYSDYLVSVYGQEATATESILRHAARELFPETDFEFSFSNSALPNWPETFFEHVTEVVEIMVDDLGIDRGVATSKVASSLDWLAVFVARDAGTYPVALWMEDTITGSRTGERVIAALYFDHDFEVMAAFDHVLDFYPLVRELSLGGRIAEVAAKVARRAD